ncbi:hypothetical protein [Francisella salina]|uniref:Uncharacterized protein n=1 Tax=Francisella salina TaxID=573569 RepID=A0ABM5MCG3_FRAST|nr:hypothetical protein [Francisella salina]AEI36828.1 hypothetical protein F7308_1904 [Francisella salina]
MILFEQIDEYNNFLGDNLKDDLLLTRLNLWAYLQRTIFAYRNKELIDFPQAILNLRNEDIAANAGTNLILELVIEDFNKTAIPYAADAMLYIGESHFFKAYKAHVFYGMRLVEVVKFRLPNRPDLRNQTNNYPFKPVVPTIRLKNQKNNITYSNDGQFQKLYDSLMKSNMPDIYFFKNKIPVRTDKYGSEFGYISVMLKDGNTYLKPIHISNIINKCRVLLIHDGNCNDKETLLSIRAYIIRKSKIDSSVGIVSANDYDYIMQHHNLPNTTITSLSLIGHCTSGSDLLWESEKIVAFMKKFSTKRVHFIGCHTSNMDLTYSDDTLMKLFHLMQPMMGTDKVRQLIPTIQDNFKKNVNSEDISLVSAKGDKQWINVKTNREKVRLKYSTEETAKLDDINKNSIKTLFSKIKSADFTNVDFKKSLVKHIYKMKSNPKELFTNTICASERLVLEMLKNNIKGSVKGYTEQCNVNLSTGKAINTKHFLFKDYDKFDKQNELGKQKKQQFIQGFYKGYYDFENNFNPAKSTSRASTYVVGEDNISAYSEQPFEFSSFPMCPTCGEFMEERDHECEVF